MGSCLPTSRRTTPCCWSRSADPRSPTTWCRSWRTSPAAAASRASGWRRSGSTTSSSAVARRSTTRTARSSPRSARTSPAPASTCRSTGATATGTPYLADTLAQMAADGVRRAAVLRRRRRYSSYSGCRQYRENLADAVAEVAGGAPARPAAALLQPPGLRRARRRRDARRARRAARRGPRASARLVFVTHSIPAAMNDDRAAPTAARTSPSTAASAAEIVERVRQETGRRHPHELVYCSRSGPPQVPWLEPDVNDHLEAAGRARACRPWCWSRSASSPTTWRSSTTSTPRPSRPPKRLGLPAARAATPGIDPRFVAMVRDLLVERAAVERGDRGHPAGRRVDRRLARRLRPGLLPQPARRAPGALRSGLVSGPRADRARATWRSRSPAEAAALVAERRAAGVSVADTKSSRHRRGHRGRPRQRGADPEPAPRRPARRRLPRRGGRRPGSAPAACAGSSTRSTAPSTSSTAFPQYAVSIAAEWQRRDRRRRRRRRPVGSRVRRGPRPRSDARRRTPPGRGPRRRCASGWSSPASATSATCGSTRPRQSQRLLPEVRDIRRMGSSALDLCQVAEGTRRRLRRGGLQPWDRAAASLVLTEAGGRFAVLPGTMATGVPGWPEETVVTAAPADGWDDFVTRPRDGRLPRRTGRE